MPNTQLTALLLAGLTALSCQGQTRPAAVSASVSPVNAAPVPENFEIEQAFHSVNPQAIRATMSFLADDLIQGRQPGTRGFSIASRYIETRFMALGLKPGVEGKSYIQPVPLKKGVTVESESSLTLETGTPATARAAGAPPLVYGRDFFLSPNLVDPVSEVKAPLVFVGFGVYAPELKYDDYQKTDVKGKIVVYFDGAPATFPSNERAYFSSAQSKYAEALKRGAVGVLTIQSPGSQRSSWDATIRRVGQGTFRWADSRGQAQGTYPQLKVIGALNPEQSEKLFSGSVHDWLTVTNKAKAGQPQSFPLGFTAAMKATTRVSDIQSSNLIGVIPGSDPVLKDQYVVYAAHLDHFGIGAPLKGDSLYNGAHDNASGVSILLEIAQAFRNLPAAPKRSVIIAVVTGEEYGLLGSDYFINNPTVDRKNIIANISLDMPFFFHPVLDIVPYGALHSSLSRPVETAAKYMGLKIGPDPFPEQVVFIRSDHYSFIRKGIPSLFIKSGFMTVPSDTVDRSKSDVDWRRTTYHTPQDDMSQAFDFDAAATHVKLNFLIGLLICEDSIRPVWNKDDFFGGRFTNSQ